VGARVAGAYKVIYREILLGETAASYHRRPRAEHLRHPHPVPHDVPRDAQNDSAKSLVKKIIVLRAASGFCRLDFADYYHGRTFGLTSLAEDLT